tara:strand:+ start:564 stop:770 length:207 start_codon:yes stop_codon:yes gene_type:complete
MSQNDELLKELEKQLKDSEARFKMYADKLDNKMIRSDMLESFELIKQGKLNTNELIKKAEKWQSNLDK